MTKIEPIENQIAGFLSERKNSLEKFAVATYDHSVFMKSAMLAIGENEELKKCLATPAGKTSLYNAMKFAATTGLSLNPQEGKAALVAYGGKVQYQIMKNGLIDLAMSSGQVDFLSSDTVRKNDKFEIAKTMDGDKYNFVPALSERGDILGFFAAVKLKNGQCHVAWMTKSEVDEHKNKYSKAKGDFSPWQKSFEGMGIKTVIKKLFRNLHLSGDVTAAIGSDDASESGDFDFDVETRGATSEQAAEKLQTPPVEKDITPMVEAKKKGEGLF
jgi:phage RecT family recombinase